MSDRKKLSTIKELAKFQDQVMSKSKQITNFDEKGFLALEKKIGLLKEENSLKSKVKDKAKEILDTLDDQNSITGKFINKKVAEVALAQKINSTDKTKIQAADKILDHIDTMLANEKNIGTEAYQNLEVTEDLLDAFHSLNLETEDVVANLNDSSTYMNSMNEKLSDIVKEADDFKKKFTDLADQAEAFVTTLLTNPMALITAATALAVSQFKELVSSAMEFRKELGIGVAQASALAFTVDSTAKKFSLLGVSAEDVKTTVTEIQESFGGISAVSSETLKSITALSAEFGVSGKNATVLLKQMEAINGNSLETNINLLESAASLAKANGVAPAAIMDDVAESTEFFAKFAKDGGRNVLQASINARKLGVNMATVEKIVDGVMDIENSIAAEMEASVLLGRQINLNKAREAFLTGDIATGQKEIVKQLGSSAEFNEMNYYQRQALAKSLGVEVSELAKMIANQEKLNNMTEFERTTRDMTVQLLEYLGGGLVTLKKFLFALIPPLGVILAQTIGIGNALGLGFLALIVPLFEKLPGLAQAVIIGLTGIGLAMMMINKQSKIFSLGGMFSKGIGGIGEKVKGLSKSMGGFMSSTKGGGMSSIFSGAGKINMGTLAKGAGVLLLMAFAIGVLGLALQTFTGIDFGQVFTGLGALVAFSVVAALLGSFAAVIALGALVIAGLGLSLIVLGAGLMVVATAMNMLVPNLNGISALASSFSQLGVSLITLAGGLALMTPFLPSLMVLSAFGAIGGLAGGAGGGGGEDSLGAKIDATNQKLDQLIAVMQEGGDVMLDGKKVGDVVGNRGIMKPSIA